MNERLRRGDRDRTVQLRREGQTFRVQLDGDDGPREIAGVVVARDDTTLVLEIDGRRHQVRYARQGADLFLQREGLITRVHRVDAEEEEARAALAGTPRVLAPMPGKVLEVLVQEGDEVVAGQTLVRLEAMKMEVDLDAGFDAVVQELHVKAEQLVDPEQVLVTLAPRDAAD